MLIDAQAAASAEPRTRREDAWRSRRRRTSRRASRSISIRPSRSRKSCSTSRACRCKKTPERRALHRRRVLQRTGARLPAAEAAARIPRPGQTEVHLHRQAAAHGGSATPGACTPTTRRPWRSPGGWPATIPTCRTSRSAPPKAGASAKPSSRRRAATSCRPTIRRSNCASWRTSRATRACCRPSPTARTSTAPPPPKCSASSLHAVDSEQRRYAKVINFGLIYGMSAFGLAAPTRHRARRRAAVHRPLFRALSRRGRIHGRTREQAREQGYVETVFGRRLWLPEINSSNGARRQGAERAAINAPMQGTAADLIKLAMIAVQDWLDAEQLADASSSCRCMTNWCWKCRTPNCSTSGPDSAADDRRGAAGGAAGGGRRRRAQLGPGALTGGPGRQQERMTLQPDHWNQHARQWQPDRPRRCGRRRKTSVCWKTVADWCARTGVTAPHALLCGVTPEIARMRWPANTWLTAVDHSRPMIAACGRWARRRVPRSVATGWRCRWPTPRSIC